MLFLSLLISRFISIGVSNVGCKCPTDISYFHFLLRCILLILALFRFFRICTEVCVDVCYRALNDPQVSVNLSLTRARCYHTLDAFVRLIALLVRHSGDAANTLTKINLLNKVGLLFSRRFRRKSRLLQWLVFFRQFNAIGPLFVH